MRKKLLILLASFTIAFSTVACLKPAEDAEKKPGVENEAEKEVENFVNVDENDKKRVMDLIGTLSSEDYESIKGMLHEEVKQYQNEESYELNLNVVKDTGKLGDFEALIKEEREDSKLGNVALYSGQIKGENQDLAFDIIVTKDDQIIDWRFFPMQDQEENKKKYDHIVKKFENIADMVESDNYEGLKPELALMEMSEEEHENFETNLKTVSEQVKSRKEFNIVEITDRTALKSLKEIKVEGKIVNVIAFAKYEEGPEVQYSAVFAEDGRLLSIGVNPKQEPQMQLPPMQDENTEDLDGESQDSETENTEIEDTETDATEGETEEK